MTKGDKHIGRFIYLRCESEFYDAVNDFRQTNNNGYIKFERCTVANSTKGSGTWVETKYEPEINYPTESPETKFYRGDKTFAEMSVGGGGWRANVYMQTSDSNVSGYKEILYTLEATETEIATTLTNTTVLTQTYLYPSGIGVELLPAGQWGFSETNKLSDTAGGGQVTVLYQVFARHLNGSETNLFTIESNPITWTEYTEMRTTKSISGYAVLATDRIGFRRSVISTYTNSKTLTYIVGNGRGGYMNTTVATRHKELRALNEDAAFQHVDSSSELGEDINETNHSLFLWNGLKALKVTGGFCPCQVVKNEESLCKFSEEYLPEIVDVSELCKNGIKQIIKKHL